MPLYRLGNDGNWKKIVSMFRLGNDGIWKKIVAMYRLGNDGNWKKILSALADAPSITTAPTLRNATNVDPTTSINDSLFFGGDTISLTRGAYTNTTSNTNTKYTMTIYKSINYSSNINNWTVVTGPTIYYGNNSNTNTSITYTVTDVDAKDGYYFAGRVGVNNDANIAGSTDTNFDIKNNNALAKISFSLSSFIYTNITSSGADFQWTVSGVPSTNFTTYFYNQKLEIKRASDNVTVHTVDGIAVSSSGTTYVTVSSANILESTTYYGVVTVTANDGWKTSNYPTTQISATSNFTTLAPRPVNIVAPAITPLNNRSYVPVNTQLTCSTGSWTNSPTSYSYSWEYDNGNNQLPPEDRWGQIPGSTNSNIYTPPSNYTSLYNSKIRCLVTATNAAGSNEAIAGQYFVDPEVTISAISPTSVIAGQSTNFAFTVSGYPTSYVIDWTNDGVTDYTSPAIASGTSSVNASVANIYSAGTSTLKVTAQPGNKQRTASISAVNTPSASGFTKANGTATPSQPTAIQFSSENNQVTSSWTNGSPITSVRFQGSGAGVNTDYSDTTSPFMTSDVSNYSSSATYDVTVTNTNSSLAVLVSWNQSNAASYKIDYSSSIFGADVATGDSSDSSVSVSIPWNSNMGTFTLPGITVYSGTGQTGLSTFYSNPTGTGGVVPSSKSSTRTGSTSLIYSVAKPSGGSVTLTGSGVSGTSVSASTSGWSGNPTSYAVNIRVSTSSPVTSSGTSKASNSPATSTSASYTVTTGDANAPAYYFKAFATASNAGGTSDLVESSEILSSRLAKPTNLNLVYRGYNSALSRYEWDAYWDGSTGASSYTAYREVGTYSGGVFTVYNTSTPQTNLTTLKAGTTNTYTTLFTTTTAYNWARFYVKAVNSLDDSGYEGPSTPA